MNLIKTVNMLMVIFLLFMITTGDAQAYLDPGTGSFIFQILIAGALGGMLVIKTSWSRIRGVVSRIFSKKEKVKDENSG